MGKLKYFQRKKIVGYLIILGFDNGDGSMTGIVILDETKRYSKYTLINDWISDLFEPIQDNDEILNENKIFLN